MQRLMCVKKIQIKKKIVNEYVHQIEALLQKIKEEVIDRDVWN
jgi:hypothetical protein